MKIYVITKGCYSDYHIITATTNEKLANEIAERYEAQVEEFEETTENAVPIFEGVFNEKENSLTVDIEEDFESERKIYKYQLNKIYEVEHFFKKCSYICYIQAKNRKIAEKIFQDLLAEYKAKKSDIWF